MYMKAVKNSLLNYMIIEHDLKNLTNIHATNVISLLIQLGPLPP